VSARKRSRTTIALGLIENQNAKGEASYTSTVWATGERYTRTFTEVTRTQAKKLHIEHQHEVKNEGSQAGAA
jgi:hypothetical protein